MSEKFVRVPNQSYGKWKYETFGQMLKDKIKQRNKQLAENLDFSKNPEAVTDFVNPFGGMIKNVVKSGMTKRIVSKLPKGVKNAIGSKYVKKIPQDDFEEFIAKNDLTEAIEDYTSYMYRDINPSLRSHTKLPPEQAKLLKLFTVPGNFQGISARGAHLNPKNLAELQPGQLVKSNSILSTGDIPSLDYLYPYLDSVRTRKNTKPVMMLFDNYKRPQYDIRKFSSYPDEEEILLGPNSLFRIIERTVDKQTGIPLIRMEAIADEIAPYIEKNALPLLGAGGLMLLPEDGTND